MIKIRRKKLYYQHGFIKGKGGKEEIKQWHISWQREVCVL
jgi:hypothetical protein